MTPGSKAGGARHLIPQALLGVMSALALGAALLALLTGPSLVSIDLQVAVARTAAEPNFSFYLTSSVRDPIGTHRLLLQRSLGTWQAPNRLSLRSSAGSAYHSTVTFVIGSTQYQARRNGGYIALDVSPFLANPLSIADGPIFGLPPLGAAATATDVARHGDGYSFIVPNMTLPIGWVAYAPLSKASSAPHFPVAINTPMTAVIKKGVVVAMAFPDGIRGKSRPALGPTYWTLSHFGSAPTVKVPANRSDHLR